MRLYRIDELRRSAINIVADVIANSDTDEDLKGVRINHMADLLASCDNEEALEEVIHYLQSPRKSA